MHPIYIAGWLALAWLVVGWVVFKLNKLKRSSLRTNRDVEWLQAWALAGLVCLDLWTKWPSHFLGSMLTTNLAVGPHPGWVVAIGEWLSHR